MNEFHIQVHSSKIPRVDAPFHEADIWSTLAFPYRDVSSGRGLWMGPEAVAPTLNLIWVMGCLLENPCPPRKLKPGVQDVVLCPRSGWPRPFDRSCLTMLRCLWAPGCSRACFVVHQACVPLATVGALLFSESGNLRCDTYFPIWLQHVPFQGTMILHQTCKPSLNLASNSLRSTLSLKASCEPLCSRAQSYHASIYRAYAWISQANQIPYEVIDRSNSGKGAPYQG